MQAKNGSIIITVILCSVLLAGFMYSIQPEPVTVDVPTAASIAALIVIPASVDNSAEIASILDAVAWKSEDISQTDINEAIDYARYEIDEEDFLELLADVLGMDDDYLNIIRIDEKEIKVTAESEDDADDGNFKVEGFLRIIYEDTDLEDREVVYVVTTADITDLYDDENDQDVDYSIEEVSRNFDFD